MKQKSSIYLALVISILGLFACTAEEPQFEFAWLWARPGDLEGSSAIYMVIKNNGPSDALLSVSSSIADIAQIHRTTPGADGTVSMVEQEFVDLPVGEWIYFQPGGLHLMLLGLETPLADGDTFPLTLEFENAKDLTIEVQVSGP
jgi:copper(I)-binding protein